MALRRKRPRGHGRRSASGIERDPPRISTGIGIRMAQSHRQLCLRAPGHGGPGHRRRAEGVEMNGPSGPPRSADSYPEHLIHSHSADDLIAAAGDPRLTEDLALGLLARRDLPAQALDALSKNSALAKYRKVRLAVVGHPRTPRHISIPVIRHLYTFELMQVALLPAVAPDIKRVAEEVLIGRLDTISAGERS